MTIEEKLPRYNRTVKKVLRSHKLTQEQIEETETLFIENHLNLVLHYKAFLNKNRNLMVQ